MPGEGRNVGRQGGIRSASDATERGDGKCHTTSGLDIPCQRESGWAGGDGCYYKPTEPSASTVAALGGRPSGAGGWYQRTCFSTAGYQACSAADAARGLCFDRSTRAEIAFGGPVWVAGAPPVISPEVLARRAVSRLTLPGPTDSDQPGRRPAGEAADVAVPGPCLVAAAVRDGLRARIGGDRRGLPEAGDMGHGRWQHRRL
jgi:hypothetical protein